MNYYNDQQQISANYEQMKRAEAMRQDMMNAASMKLGCGDPIKESEITIEMRRLDTEIEKLQEMLHRLGTRLMAVTRNTDLGPRNDHLAAPPCTTQLGTALRAACEKIEEMTYRVGQQIDLTEL